MRFNPPPGWPAAPPGYVPPADWRPDPSWPAAPPGWQFWLPDDFAPARRPPLTAGAKRAGIAVVSVAVAIAVLSIVFIARDIGSSIGQSLFGSTSTTPIDQVRHLSAGKYIVYERTGSSGGFGPISVSGASAANLTPDEVQVTDQGGSALSVDVYTSNSTINRSGAIYAGALYFHVPTSGAYRIQVTTDTPQQLIIAKDLGKAFAAAGPWFAAGFAGLVLLVVGIVVLVRGPRTTRS